MTADAKLMPSRTHRGPCVAHHCGRCVTCGGSISPGDTIERSLHGWSHHECPGDLSEDDVEDCMLFLQDAGDR